MKSQAVHLTTTHCADDVRIFKRECRSLAEDGYAVTYIATESDNDHSPDGEVAGIKVKQLKEENTRLGRMTMSTLRVMWEALKNHSEIYHFHDPELIPVGLLLRACRKRVIYDVHENFPEQVRHLRGVTPTLRPTLAWICDRLEKSAAKHFSAIIAANSEIYSRFSDAQTRVIELNNYPRLEEFEGLSGQNNFARDPMMLVNFGGISWHTCTNEIVHALALLPKELGAKLHFGGRICSEELFHTVNSNTGWQRVRFVGLISRDQMNRTLQRASVSIVLYAPEPNHFGVGSNRFFESLAAGVPVIASNFPNWKRTIDEIGCGLSVDPKAPEAISEAIQYLLSHPEEAAEMGARGQKAVHSHLNWKHEEHRLLELYGTLLQSTPERTRAQIPVNAA